MVTTYQPRAMIYIITWHNLITLIAHHCLTGALESVVIILMLCVHCKHAAGTLQAECSPFEKSIFKKGSFLFVIATVKTKTSSENSMEWASN